MRSLYILSFAFILIAGCSEESKNSNPQTAKDNVHTYKQLNSTPVSEIKLIANRVYSTNYSISPAAQIWPSSDGERIFFSDGSLAQGFLQQFNISDSKFSSLPMGNTSDSYRSRPTDEVMSEDRKFLAVISSKKSQSKVVELILYRFNESDTSFTPNSKVIAQTYNITSSGQTTDGQFMGFKQGLAMPDEAFILNLATGENYNLFSALNLSKNDYVIELTFVPDRHYVIISAGGLKKESSRIIVWDLDQKKSLFELPEKKYDTMAPQMVSNTSFYAVDLSTQSTIVVNLSDFSTKTYSQRIDMHINRSGKYFLSGSYNGGVFNVENLNKLTSLASNFRGYWLSTLISPNDRTALSYDELRKEYVFYDINSSREISRFQGFPRNLTSVTFSPDSHLAVLVYLENDTQSEYAYHSYQVVDVATGKILKQLTQTISPYENSGKERDFSSVVKFFGQNKLVIGTFLDMTVFSY